MGDIQPGDLVRVKFGRTKFRDITRSGVLEEFGGELAFIFDIWDGHYYAQSTTIINALIRGSSFIFYIDELDKVETNEKI